MRERLENRLGIADCLLNGSMPDVCSSGLDTGSGGTVSAKILILALCAQYCNGPVGMEPGPRHRFGSADSTCLYVMILEMRILNELRVSLLELRILSRLNISHVNVNYLDSITNIYYHQQTLSSDAN